MAKKGKGTGSWGLMVLGFVLGVVCVVVLMRFLGTDKPKKETVEPIQTTVDEPRVVDTGKPTGETATIPHKTVVPPPKVSIVIDDMGADINKLRELVALDASITIAVMPHQRFSKEVATEAHSKGLDVILHLPMEPKDMGGNDPGVGALLVAMTHDEVKTQMENGLKTVPYAVGVNNHMGSKFTEDEDLMKTVLNVAKRNRLFFLDSRTSGKSVVGKIARQLKVGSVERSVFLDNTRDKQYIKGQIRELASIARKRGAAIGIGHPYPETIAALKDSVAELEKEGIEIVGISELVNKK